MKSDDRFLSRKAMRGTPMSYIRRGIFRSLRESKSCRGKRMIKNNLAFVLDIRTSGFVF